jgi:hypothetical protein
MKKWLKSIAFLFAALFFLGIVIQIVDPEGTNRRAEEAAERAKARGEARASKKSSAKDRPGFTSGFMEGSLRKSRGFKKPSSDDVDALARSSANTNDIPQDKRSEFVGNYTDAFWMGWNRAK